MSIDMRQFHQVFFEETAEHLAGMESLLLGLDLAAPDAEQLNAIFRAAHSIKGSAGTFGFTDLADVTHVLESLLDRIRKGELALSGGMIDTFLAAGDALKAMLAAHRGEGAADPAAAVAIRARLEALAAGGTAAAPETAAPTVSPAPTFHAPAATAAAGGLEARFVLDDASDAVVERLLDALGDFGATRLLARPAVPGEAWRVAIDGAADAAGVREVLEFVARSDSIRVGRPGEPAHAPDDADDGAYGFFNASPAASAPPAPALVEDAYGFFEPLPERPVAPAGVAAAPAPPPSAAHPVRAAAAAGEATIRVGVGKVDQLINLVGELVITQAMLAQSAAGLDPVAHERLHNGMAQFERNSRDLQEAVMTMRMMPISGVFSRFPRLVHDLAHKLGKQIELRTLGEDTELDKGLIERIADPLTHLVRNSLDHGIEMPAARAARGKPPAGTITLKAYHQAGSIVIEVGDDGAGLSRERILAKARERGLRASEAMADAEVWQLIFEPGFSTAEQVTDVSGRGVGMDVVRRNITAMGGRVDIESLAGVGTRMTVRLPLTLAILDGMSVAVGAETYIVPLGCVIETLQAERAMIKSVSGVERLVLVHDDYLPVVVLHELFGVPGAATRLDRGIMVVVDADGMQVALFVDALAGQHQVVIKSLEANYRKVAGIAGATIMGDGRVALILDVAALAARAKSALPAAA